VPPRLSLPRVRLRRVTNRFALTGGISGGVHVTCEGRTKSRKYLLASAYCAAVPAQPVFQLHIRLEGVAPAIWRRLLVPGNVNLPKLHAMFQAAMGWTDSHSHSFSVGGERYGTVPDDWPEEEEEETDESDVVVRQALAGQRRFFYEYDFGDSWEHEVVVENIIWTPLALKHAVCLDGQNACPPEDVGGRSGYARFLEAIANPTHEDHHLWNGFHFDPAAFDLATANAELQRVR
jgi:hypothetical protein